MTECLVCRELTGGHPVPGGFLWDDEHVAGFHLPPLEGRPDPYLGHLLVVTKRHVDHLSDLTEEEVTSVALAARALAAAMRAEGVERVHVAVIGLGVPHFHLHLYPRYHGVPDDTSWMDVDALPDAPHGGAAEIGALADRLRARV